LRMSFLISSAVIFDSIAIVARVGVECDGQRY
jgi:hypothetical protein